jgi:ABC-2 type transport system permease protein
VNFAIVLVVGLVFHWFAIGWQSLVAVLLLAELIGLSIGVGLLLAAGFVHFRDLGYIWEVLLMLLFYASAVIFPVSLLSHQLQGIIDLNPIAQIVQDLRRSLVSPSIPWSAGILGSSLAVPVVAVCLSMVAGMVVFARMSRGFGDQL